MPKATTDPIKQARKFVSFLDVPLEDPFLGVFLDPNIDEVPPGGFSVQNGFHYYKKRLMCYPGWRAWKPDGTNALATANATNYGYDFTKENQNRYFILGDKAFLYLFNRDVNPLTSDAANTLTPLNGTGRSITGMFTGGTFDRWASAVIQDSLILTNISTPYPVVFVDNDTELTALAGDGSMPKGAKYMINCAGHIIMANLVDAAGNPHPTRIAWSDIGQPTVWAAALGTNEAGTFDLDADEGEIRGMGCVGPNQFVVYSTNNTYLFTYVGLPTIWNIQTKLLTDIGIFPSYSLGQKENQHFFMGLDGFYTLPATLAPQRIGEDMVDNTIYNLLQLNAPWLMYSFVHPIYPEIWWIYQGRNDAYFARAIIYNWERGCWAQRDPIGTSPGFPFGMCAEFMLAASRTMNQITTPASTTLTWSEKAGSGSLVTITGDINGALYIHDGTDQNANGSPLARQLRSGELNLGDNARPIRISRIWYELTDIDFTQAMVTSTLLSRTNPTDDYGIVDIFNLDSDSRHDIRAIDKNFMFGLDTYNTPSLSGVIFQTGPAGQRA